MDNYGKLIIQFKEYVKSGVEADLIVYINKEKDLLLKLKTEVVDNTFEKVGKIYFDGKRRFICTTLNNYIMIATFEKLPSETEETIFQMYENKIMPFEGYKYYSESELKNGEFEDFLVNLTILSDGSFEFKINKERMISSDTYVHYVFFGNLTRIVWFRETNNNIINKLITKD